MSHIVCPLCGLNAPLDSFNPENQDLDLQLTTFRGLGRGMGFSRDQLYTVLGDDCYSPMVADRVIDLCKMFLDVGTISQKNILERLELKDSLLKLGNYVSKADFIILVSQLSLTQQQLENEKINTRRTRALLLENEREKEEREKERKIEEILLKINRYCDTKIIIDEETFKWIVIVNKIDAESYLFLKKISEQVDNETRSLLKKRLKGHDMEIQLLLDEFLKRRKTFSEKLLEMDLGKFSRDDKSFFPL